MPLLGACQYGYGFSKHHNTRFLNFLRKAGANYAFRILGVPFYIGSMVLGLLKDYSLL